MGVMELVQTVSPLYIFRTPLGSIKEKTGTGPSCNTAFFNPDETWKQVGCPANDVST